MERGAQAVRRLYQIWWLHAVIVLAGFALLCLDEHRHGWVPAHLYVGAWLCWCFSFALVTWLYRVGLRDLARRAGAERRDA